MTFDPFAPAVVRPRVTRSDRLTMDSVADFGPGDRVIMAEAWGADEVADAIRARGAEVIVAQHWMETESVYFANGREAVHPEYALPVSNVGARTLGRFFDPTWAEASRAAFEVNWDALSVPLDPNPVYVPAKGLVDDSWLSLLPYATLNPAQAEALPAILGDESLIVAAPTGAGKTVIGMLSALKEIKGRGHAVAWLVPQRTLTAELDRDLEGWRAQGLKVERLSGEFAIDAAAIATADLIVATTEKFESLCRSASLAEVVKRVGTIIVDEIHLLGEPGRGAVLETLLARIRVSTKVRLVGLSATVANAQEVADWLGATLVRIKWRPTRLNQQVLTIPAGDRQDVQHYRSATATHIVQEITAQGGSTVVFCGPKFSVRSTALDIARSRGFDVSGIDVNDNDAVAQVAHAAKIGLHYSDWPHRHLAEKSFRAREFDVLIATSTVAAGVNLPARAVVIRDTSIGPNKMEVSMIQQMVGRAGRAGQESEGWAFILTQGDETAEWRTRLADGYTVRSRIAATLKDHLLGEIVQKRITTAQAARDWWGQTLASFQGQRSEKPLEEAMEALTKNGFVKLGDETDPVTKPTPLGNLTSRMMLNVTDAIDLRRAMQNVQVLPTEAVKAEAILIDALAGLSTFQNMSAPPNDEQRIAVLRAIPTHSGDPRVITRNRGGKVDCDGEHVVRAALWLAAAKPEAFRHGGSTVAGIQKGLLTVPLGETPRYLAWMAAQGALGTIPTWSSVVASDLGRRVKWHTLGAQRGDGRALRAAEKEAGPRGQDSLVGKLFEKHRGIVAPSLRVKTTIVGRDMKVNVEAPASASVFVLDQPLRQSPIWRRTSPKGAASVQGLGDAVVAAFTKDGDVVATGWLAAFTR